MSWLKTCPKCDGDIFENKDTYGSFMSCLQCGHYLTVAEEAYIQLKARVVFARDRLNQLDSLTPELVMVKQYISEAAKHLGKKRLRLDEIPKDARIKVEYYPAGPIAREVIVESVPSG